MLQRAKKPQINEKEKNLQIIQQTILTSIITSFFCEGISNKNHIINKIIPENMPFEYVKNMKNEKERAKLEKVL
jgi:hypothetical protein